MGSSNCNYNLLYGLQLYNPICNTIIFYNFGCRTVYATGLIRLDRYVKSQYKTNYTSVLTSKRVHLLIFTIYRSVVLRASINTAGSVLDKITLFLIFV